jgi:hypothetical protein
MNTPQPETAKDTLAGVKKAFSLKVLVLFCLVILGLLFSIILFSGRRKA